MWRQATVTVDENLAEPLSDWFSEAGAVSVGFSQARPWPAAACP